MQLTPSVASVAQTGNKIYGQFANSFRTEDISEGLEQVKLFNEQKQNASKKLKKRPEQEESMPSSIQYSMVHSQVKPNPLINNPYDSQNFIELNLTRNFGGMSLEDSARPDWQSSDL